MENGITRRNFVAGLAVAAASSLASACGKEPGREETTGQIDDAVSTSDDAVSTSAETLLDNYKEALEYKIALAFDAEPEDIQIVQLSIQSEENQESQVYGVVINNELYYVQDNYGNECYKNDMIKAASEAGISAISADPIAPAIDSEIKAYFMDLETVKPDSARAELNKCANRLCQYFWKKEGAMLQAYEKPKSKTKFVDLENEMSLERFKQNERKQHGYYENQAKAIADFKAEIVSRIVKTLNANISDVTLVDALPNDWVWGKGFTVNSALYVSEPSVSKGGEVKTDGMALENIVKYAENNDLTIKWVDPAVTSPAANCLASSKLSNPNYLVALFDGERTLDEYNWGYKSNGTIFASPKREQSKERTLG